MSRLDFRSALACLVFAQALLGPASALAQPPSGYYAEAEGLTGASLRQALHGIIDGHQVHSYSEAEDWVKVLDQDPADATQVRLLYSRSSVPKSSWPEYNREHVWPQSLGAIRRPAKSDMHHIFAEDAGVNSARGNKPFDNCPGDCRSHPEAPEARYGSGVWEPPDVAKGDIARALFYMDVRYEGGGGEPDLVLGDQTPAAGCNCMGRLSTLLTWHVLDPVDENERRRNDQVFASIQGNRNPFVDHPEWVQSIWGGAEPAPPVATGPTTPTTGQEQTVRLQSTHPLGVPLHSQAGGSATYQRVASGTVARVLGTSDEGRWLQLFLPDGRSGWVTRRHVSEFSSVPAPDSPTTPPDGEATLLAHFINVGQANATLLEFPCGAVLIDAGAQSEAQIPGLLTYLRTFFARRQDLDNTLDAILITHNHVDHTRALREVVEAFRIRHLIENGQRGGLPEGDRDVDWVVGQAAARDIDVRVVRDADVAAQPARRGLTDADIDPIACPGIDPVIRVLSSARAAEERPNWPAGAFENKNNHSIVTRVDFGQAAFLFTGDLEEPAAETLVSYYQGTDALDVDCYEVGHHGSHNGTTQSLLEAMTPDLAVISMGPWNDQQPWTAWQYGHPRHEAVALLQDAIATTRSPATRVHIAWGQRSFYEATMNDGVYGTGWDGTVVLRAHGDGRIERVVAPLP